MADNIQCPHCEAEIEADSIFCDQCGKELNKCPRCGLFRRGRFCPTCGVPTEPASKLADQQPQQPEPQRPVQQSYGSGGYNQAFPTSSPAGGGGGTQIQGAGAGPVQASPTKLTCRELGIIIPLQPDAVVGRNTGNYVAQLSSLRFLSGRHAQLSFNGVQWSITDLGSTNGTAVNGIPCTPMQPRTFAGGDTICLAKSYNFIPE